MKPYQFVPPSSVTNENMSFFPLTFVSVGAAPEGQSKDPGHVMDMDVDVYVNMIVNAVTMPEAAVLFIAIDVMLSFSVTVNMFATFRSSVNTPEEEETAAFSSRENVPTPAAVISSIITRVVSLYICHLHDCKCSN